MTMKLKKFEVVLIAAALLAVGFCGGFFYGRRSARRVVTVEVGASQQTASVSSAAPAADSSAGSSSAAGRIDINTAAKAELESLPGIGEELADRIIQYREENGPFASAEDIQNVRGIGAAKYEALKEYITAGGTA